MTAGTESPTPDSGHRAIGHSGPRALGRQGDRAFWHDRGPESLAR
ncbi:unnamed protein product, partial [Staurois parvus]